MKHRLICLSCGLLSSLAHGQLKALSDDELESTSGKAFIEMEQFQNNGLHHTRVNFGLDVSVQLNADSLVLGKYPRAGETLDADLDFDNFSLGHIENGQIVPFQMRDPFIEVAYEKNGNQNNLVGFRYGFGDAKGKMSMDINSLTGNVDVILQGDYVANTWLGDITVEATSQANLVNSSGELDPIRADSIGVPNGSSFDAVAFGFIPVSLGVNNCTVSGFGVNDTVCFPLSNYKTLDIGTKKGENEFDYAPGMFLSFQARDMIWGTGGAKDPITQTSKGFFFNIPNGSLTLTPSQAQNGTPWAQTEFIDRGVGRFTGP
ncbi:hypothetical protein A9Q81_18060 [Gammaproteobacteria bacterium 42_54_T18]|nr:hypothetical protein A9Q81_18060 [Gammaproteobacteria bacterium 42_54_T18]